MENGANSMRKNKQKELLGLVNTLKGANSKMANLLLSGEKSAIKEFLMACQQGAIAIGEAIEQSEGQGLSVITTLEEYCENIYKACIELDEPCFSYTEFRFQVEEELAFIEEGIKELPIKKEIVFLPYKAAMWDCLESIWLAAKEDENCECYVIPIPYYEFVKNGEPILHYEGDLMPEYVPVTHYENYDLQARKPDVIYFHNPYDQYNNVTSVHPNYYSDKLKQCTDMLVYVPYYLTNGAMPDNLSDLPSYHNADRIILENEKQVEEVAKYISREKLLPLGSPKVDRIMWYDAHKPEIPENWKKIIGNKKVVMYNISISGLLKHGEKFFAKMKYIFDTFQKRDDVVLLWRPHPLLKATLQSMRPEWKQEYERLEREFIQKKIGILDTTADITKSVAICDGYMGEDTSSVVEFFGICEKPILILDVEVTKENAYEERQKTFFLDCAVEGKNIWFVANGYNAICKTNIQTKITEFVARIPGEQYGADWLYCGTVFADDKLFLIPQEADALCIYDMKEKRFQKNYLNNAVRSNYDMGIMYKKALFLKPLLNEAIAKYDIELNRLEAYTDGVEALTIVSNEEKSSEYRWGVTKIENKLLMAAAHRNAVLETNLDNGEFNIYSVGKQDNRFFGMEYDGENYWLLPYKGKDIVKWNYEANTYDIYNEYPVDIHLGEIPFRDIVRKENKMLLFPYQCNEFLEIDISTGEIKKADVDLPCGRRSRRDWTSSISAGYLFVKKECENEYIAYKGESQSFIIIDKKTFEFREILCRLKKKDIIRINNEYLWNDSCKTQRFYESAVMNSVSAKGISAYLDYLGSEYVGINKKSIVEKNIGKQIHMQIMEKV